MHKSQKPMDDLVEVHRELMVALSRSTSLEETLEHCYLAAIRISGMDSGGIYLMDSDGRLRLRFHRNLGPKFLQANEVVEPDDPRFTLVQKGQPLYSTLGAVQERIGSHDAEGEETNEGLRAIAIVPILFDDEVVGCMNLASHEVDQVSDQSREVLEILAKQIAQSISREMVHAKLQESEENLQTFFDCVDDFLFVLDEEGQILQINTAASRVLGRSAEQMAGRSIADVHPRDPSGQMQSALRDVLAGRFLAHDLPLVGSGGRVIPAETRITHGSWNGEAALFCVTRDMTGPKKAEQERLELERQLFQSQKLESLGLMASGIAHDFNNILVSVLGTASAALAEAEGDADADAELSAQLKEIISGSQQAAALCRQMLAYSGRGRFVIEPLDLSEQVRELTGLIKATEESAIAIDLRLAEGLPRFEGDATQISQVVMNLVLNAREAIGSGRGTIWVETGRTHLKTFDLDNMISSAAEPGEFVYLHVADDGEGMSPETESKIFDPFFTTKSTGRGLGMSTVLGIVRGHSGALSLRTRQGQGTAFRVFFPVAQAAPGPSIKVPSTLSEPDRIMVVDDDPSVLRLIGRVLQNAKLDFVAFESGSEAVASFAKEPGSFDLVLLDLTMPVLDGASTLASLADIDASVPIVIMSGFSEHEFPTGSGGHQPAGFLGKPFTRDELLAAVRNHARPTKT